MNANDRIKQLQDEIKGLEEQARKEREDKRKQDEKDWRELIKNKAVWEYSVKAEVRRPFMCEDEPIKNGVRVHRRVLPSIIETFAQTHPEYRPDERFYVNWNGMFYYRTDENILYHEGGGTYVLNDVTICSDAEWEQILDGMIPERLIK